MKKFTLLWISACCALLCLSPSAFGQDADERQGSNDGEVADQDSDVEQSDAESQADPGPQPAEPEELPPCTKLIVATKHAPPFSIKTSDNEWEGISIQLWKRIAAEIGCTYEISETDIPGMVSGLQNGSYDAAVAAMTVTADRELIIDFTHPFYTTGLGIAYSPDATQGVIGTIAGLFSVKFVRALGGLILVLFFVGIIVWLFERRKNKDEFGGSPIQGIGAGFWWSAVTMTTVGYGDKTPVTFGGRLIGLVWMFVSIITISGFTASIASALTVSQLGASVTGPDDLPRVRVGSVAETTSSQYLAGAHINYVPYETVQEGLEAVANEEIDAMVYDAPILKYFANREFSGKVRVLGQTFERQNYAIGLPSKSPIREKVNQSLLKQTREPWWNDTLYLYLGR